MTTTITAQPVLNPQAVPPANDGHVRDNLTADERLLRKAVARCLKAQVAEVYGKVEGGAKSNAVPEKTTKWDQQVMKEVRPIWFGLFKKGGDKALQNIRRFPKHARKMAVLSWAEMEASERVEVKQIEDTITCSIPIQLTVTEDSGVCKGGSGSGNFGHEGRPGEVGGSGSGGGSGEESASKTEIIRENKPGLYGSRYINAVVNGRPWKIRIADHEAGLSSAVPLPEVSRTYREELMEAATIKNDNPFTMNWITEDPSAVNFSDIVGIIRQNVSEEFFTHEDARYGGSVSVEGPPSNPSVEVEGDYVKEKSLKASSSIVIPEWIEDPDVLDALEAEMFKFAHGINQTTADALREELVEGMENGETIGQLSDRISGLSDEWVEGWRSEMIARTETARAFSTGHIEAWKSTGVVSRVIWKSAGDACLFCQQMDGTVVELGENFFDQGEEQTADWRGQEIAMGHDYSDVNGPPLHPNCYLHHTVMVTTDSGKKMISKIKVGDRVLTARGRFRPVTRVLEKTGHYKGRAVRIMYRGWKDWGFTNRNSVTTTPEHPFLTDGGWKEAQDITPNDSLYVLASYCLACGKKIPFWRKYCCDECIYVDQPEIGKQISEIKKKRNWMKGRTGSLHHSWRGGKIWWRGKDWDVLKRKIVERDGFMCQDCGMTEEACLEKSGQPLHVHHLNPYRDSFDNSPQNLITLCVSCHAKREGTVNSRFLKRGGVSFIDTPVLAVQHIDNFKGERFYNFSVAEDESYVAQGIVNHNCRCVLVAELKDETEQETNNE